jgi:hypothetical protein
VADSGCARNASVSSDQMNQRGRGRTKGCLELLTARQNSPRQQTQRGFNDGRGTGGGLR